MKSNSSSSRSTATSPLKYPCKVCQKPFKSKMALGEHMTAHREGKKPRTGALNVKRENKNQPTVRSFFPLNVQLSSAGAPISRTGLKPLNHAPEPWVQPGSGEHGQGSMTILSGNGQGKPLENRSGGESVSNKNAVNLDLELAPNFYKAESAEKELDLKLKLGDGVHATSAEEGLDLKLKLGDGVHATSAEEGLDLNLKLGFN